MFNWIGLVLFACGQEEPKTITAEGGSATTTDTSVDTGNPGTDTNSDTGSTSTDTSTSTGTNTGTDTNTNPDETGFPPDTSDTNPPVDTAFIEPAETDQATYVGLAGTICEERAPYIVTLTGEFSSSVRICSQDTVLISGALTMLTGTTLTIEPGSNVQMADETTQLVIEAGAQIQALGTDLLPIVVRIQDSGVSAGLSWGGIVVKGNGSNAQGGGTATDSSGTIQYVQLLDSGAEVGGYSAALTLENVGSGTTISYLEIWRPLDDGISIVAGNVNMSQLIIYRPKDDAIDVTDGYTGTISYTMLVMKNGDHAIEADNRDPDTGSITALPRSNPNFHNLSIYGGKKETIYFRNGTSGKLTNSMMFTSTKCALYVSNDVHEDTEFSNILIYDYSDGAFCAISNVSKDGDSEDYAANIIEQDPQAVGFIPATSSPLLDTDNVDTSVSNYLGAFNVDDWTIGWSLFDGRTTIY